MLTLIFSTAFSVAVADDFSNPAPAIDGLVQLDVHFSEYHVVLAKSEGHIEILDKNERVLGPKLTLKDFCRASLEGALDVDGVRYNVYGNGKFDQADCTPPGFPCSKCAKYHLGKNRFFKVDVALGNGGYGLIPYRTVAVRKNVIALGTVLYIPTAKNLELPDGKRHDGYFFVGDTGALNSDQLDLFVGTKDPGWNIIGDGGTGSVAVIAYIVTDLTIIQQLQAEHRAALKAKLP